MTSGERPLADVMRAPIALNGSMMRCMGRRLSDSSPTSDTRIGWLATSPESSRSVVPELPASSGAPGWRKPAAPRPAIARAFGPAGRFGAKGGHARDRGRDVGARREIGDGGRARGGAAEHHVAMRNRLIARHSERPTHGAGGSE